MLDELAHCQKIYLFLQFMHKILKFKTYISVANADEENEVDASGDSPPSVEGEVVEEAKSTAADDENVE